jgi:hypothetical protein
MLSVFALVTVSALVIRFFGISFYPLYFDELFSLLWSRIDPAFLWREGPVLEGNPPLYYLLLHAWIRLVGEGEAALRAPSALAMALAAGCTFLAGWVIRGQALGLLAGMLAALLPFSVLLGQAARPVVLSGLVQAVALVLTLAYVLAPVRRGTAEGDGGARRYEAVLLALFGLVAILLVHTHAMSVLFAALCGLCLAVQAALRGWRSVVLVGVCGLIVLAVSVPQLLAYVTIARSTSIGEFAPQSRYDVMRFFIALATGESLARFDLGLGARLALSAPLLALAAAGLLCMPRAAALVLASIAGGFVLLGAILGVNNLLLHPRIATALMVPFCLGLAAAALAPAGRKVRLPVLLPMLFLAMVVLQQTRGWTATWHPVQDNRLAARSIGPGEACDGPVFADGPLQLLFLALYHPAPPERFLVRGPGQPGFAFDWVLAGIAGYTVIGPEALGAHLAASRSLVLLPYARPDGPGPVATVLERPLAGWERTILTIPKGLALHCLRRSGAD